MKTISMLDGIGENGRKAVAAADVVLWHDVSRGRNEVLYARPPRATVLVVRAYERQHVVEAIEDAKLPSPDEAHPPLDRE